MLEEIKLTNLLLGIATAMLKAFCEEKWLDFLFYIEWTYF